MSITQEPFAQAWRSNRTYLVNMAFRMLGDIGEAEDIVQESSVRLSRTSPGEVEDARGWLTVVTSRSCLDHLRSARARRELPNDPTRFELFAPPAPGVDPADRVTLDEEVQSALLVMLQRLSPAERVAFILHDVFATPFEVISTTLGRPAGTCRQLARRARHKIAGTQPAANAVAVAQHDAVTEQFIAACANGDVDALLAVLHPDAWGSAAFVAGTTVTPMGPPTNRGARAVAENLIRFFHRGVTLVSHPIPGRTALLAYRDRQPFAIIVLTIENGAITKMEATLDPSAGTLR